MKWFSRLEAYFSWVLNTLILLFAPKYLYKGRNCLIWKKESNNNKKIFSFSITLKMGISLRLMPFFKEKTTGLAKKLSHIFHTILWKNSNQFFFIYLIGEQLLYNIVLVFAIHQHAPAMGTHMSPIMNPPPTSLLTSSLCLVPEHWLWVRLLHALCLHWSSILHMVT